MPGRAAREQCRGLRSAQMMGQQKKKKKKKMMIIIKEEQSTEMTSDC